MSEPFDYEHEPLLGFNVRVNTQEFGEMILECNAENTSLFLHHPIRNSDYDHMFYKMPKELLTEEQIERNKNFGAFLTAHSMGQDAFDEHASALIEDDEWTVVYKAEPTPADKEAIDEQLQAMLSRELEDLDPEDFA